MKLPLLWIRAKSQLFFGKIESKCRYWWEPSELNKSLLLYIAEPNFGQFERLEMHSIGCLWKTVLSLCVTWCVYSLHCGAGVVRQFGHLIVQFHLPFDQRSSDLLPPSNSLKIRQIVNIQSVAILRCWLQSMWTSTYFRLSLLCEIARVVEWGCEPLTYFRSSLLFPLGGWN